MQRFKGILFMVMCALLCAAPGAANSGFLDTFNRASQTLQQTTSSVENTKRSVERAGNMINKPKGQSSTAAQKSAEVQVQQISGSLSATDRAAIEKGKRAWVAAFKAADWDALVDQYAENAVIFPPDEEAKVGHAAIRANFATDEDTSEEVFETIELGGTDKTAFVRGMFSFKIKSGDNPPVVAIGKYLEIWQKQPDGTWLITHDIWNAGA